MVKDKAAASKSPGKGAHKYPKGNRGQGNQSSSSHNQHAAKRRANSSKGGMFGGKGPSVPAYSTGPASAGGSASSQRPKGSGAGAPGGPPAPKPVVLSSAVMNLRFMQRAGSAGTAAGAAADGDGDGDGDGSGSSASNPDAWFLPASSTAVQGGGGGGAASSTGSAAAAQSRTVEVVSGFAAFENLMDTRRSYVHSATPCATLRLQL